MELSPFFFAGLLLEYNLIFMSLLSCYLLYHVEMRSNVVLQIIAKLRPIHTRQDATHVPTPHHENNILPEIAFFNCKESLYRCNLRKYTKPYVAELVYGQLEPLYCNA